MGEQSRMTVGRAKVVVGINRLCCYAYERGEMKGLALGMLGGWVDGRKGWAGSCMGAGAEGREGEVS